MLERLELLAWLHLLEIPGLGLGTARHLLALAGSPEAVLGLPDAQLHELLARATGTPEELPGWLLELKLEGRVARLAGQLFQRRASA